jgi:hypothetical protein
MALAKVFISIVLVLGMLVVAGSALFENQRQILVAGSEVPNTVTIEGHDYFILPQGDLSYSLTHKGNCRACMRMRQLREAP